MTNHVTLSTPASNSQTSFDWEVFSIGRSADLAVKCDMEIKYTGKLLLVIVQNIVSKFSRSAVLNWVSIVYY